METDKHRWGIVATVDEPPELVVAFVAHHLRAGASEIHIHLDQDNPRTRALLDGVENVFVTVCDTHYWRREFGKRFPNTHQWRQTLNATRCSQKCRLDYIMHLDADEFLFQSEPIEAEFSQLPRGAYLRVPNAERVYLEGDAEGQMFTRHFRLSTRGSESTGLPVDTEGLTKNGMSGHCAGKSATPVGEGYTIGIHRPHEDKDRPAKKLFGRRAETSMILHFDGLTPLGWIYKRLRKAHQIARNPRYPVVPHSKAQIDAIIADGGTADSARALHDRMMRIAPDDQARLEEQWLLLEAELDLESSIAAMLPGQAIGLGAEVFDTWLAEHKRDLFTELGLLE